jgi:hypothetical protein
LLRNPQFRCLRHMPLRGPRSPWWARLARPLPPSRDRCALAPLALDRGALEAVLMAGSRDGKPPRQWGPPEQPPAVVSGRDSQSRWAPLVSGGSGATAQSTQGVRQGLDGRARGPAPARGAPWTGGAYGGATRPGGPHPRAGFVASLGTWRGLFSGRRGPGVSPSIGPGVVGSRGLALGGR